MNASHLLLAVCLLLALPASGSQARGLLMDFRFDALTPAGITDATGRWTAQVQGEVATAPGLRGPALAAAGKGYLQVAVPEPLTFSQGLTLEAWISPDQLLAGRLVDRSTPGVADSFCLDTHPGDALRLITPFQTLTAEHVLRAGEWFHVIALYDAAEGFLGLWVNGELVAHALVAAGQSLGGQQPITLAADPTGGNRFMGKIEGVRLYDYGLSDADVAARFAGQEIRVTPEPAAPVTLRYRNGVQVDTAALLGRNDVVYLSPASYAHEAMPVGNGRLCAVVWNEHGLDLQLNNADNVWFQHASGAVRLTAEPGLVTAPASFKQRQSLYEGRVYTTCRSAAGEWQATTTVLAGLPVVAVRITGRLAQPRLVLRLAQWRATAQPVTGVDFAGFVEDLPVREAPQYSRKLALLAGADCPVEVETPGEADGSRFVRLTLSPPGGADGRFSCTVYLANPVVAADADPQAAAQQALASARRAGWATVSAQAADRWRQYWEKSFLHLTSRDGLADYLENLWFLHLYWVGCGGEGELAVKFNGGPFLMHRDSRSWGTYYWYQNTRELYWPLPAANHLELCRGLQNLYLSNLTAHRKVAADLFQKKGLQVEETMRLDGWGDKYGNPYTLLYLSTGLEVALQLYHQANFAREDRLLREQVLPFMKEAVDFFLDYATKGPDGVYRLTPCNGRETYWRTEDGMNVVAAVREALPVLRREAERLGIFPEMQAAWQEFEEHFAPLPERPDAPLYAPCVIPPAIPASDNELINKLYPPDRTSTSFAKRFNSENVELDVIYPFAQAGLGLPNLEKAIATYHQRVHPSSYGWDWTPVCAARLGLADEAARKVAEHARNTQHWPQGWWDSPSSPYFANGLVDCPYFDSAGVNATTTTEMVLQSYGEVIRVWPATPSGWTGAYRLRAETGFMVVSEFAAGTTQYVELESLFGDVCRLINPWAEAARVTSEGREVLTSAAAELSFPTQRGKKYLVERVAAPVAELPFAPLQPAINDDVKYMDRSRRGQEPLGPRAGEPCLGITAEGMSAPRAAAADNRTKAQAAIRELVGEAQPRAGVQAQVVNLALETTPAPWLTDGVYGPRNIAQKNDAVGYVLELPEVQPITAVVWSFDRGGGYLNIHDYTVASRGWPQRVTLESSADGQNWQPAGERQVRGHLEIFGAGLAPAPPLATRWLRLRFWQAPDQPAALPCDEVEVY